MVPILNGSLVWAVRPDVIALDVVTVKLRTVSAPDRPVPVGNAKEIAVIVAGPVPLVVEETMNVGLTLGDSCGALFPKLSTAVPNEIEMPRVPVPLNDFRVTILFIGSGGTAVSIETVGARFVHAFPVYSRLMLALLRVILSAPE